MAMPINNKIKQSLQAAGGFSFFVLLPQEYERKLFVPGKFVMQMLPVGLGQLAGR